MADLYRFPTREEKQFGQELVGKKITIYWDGDNVFYPCTVIEFDSSNGKFNVEYEENSDGEKYSEDLKTSTWKIWAGTEEEYAIERDNKREALGRAAKTEAVEKIARDNQPVAPVGGGGSSRMSYTAMVIEAVVNLADRYGSSIQAIRKYVTSNFPLKQQQTASFNSLTLKALNKAVAVDVLEYDKRLYRLSNNEKERRREKDRALKAAANAQSREALNMRYRKAAANGRNGGGAVDVDGVDSSDPLLLSFYGTAAAYNKSLRKELLNVRSKRDRFLQARMRILRPFLIDKNYFYRKEKHERDKLKEKEQKRNQLKQTVLTQQAALASAGNVYATTYTTSHSSAMQSSSASNGVANAYGASATNPLYAQYTHIPNQPLHVGDTSAIPSVTFGVAVPSTCVQTQAQYASEVPIQLTSDVGLSLESLSAVFTNPAVPTSETSLPPTEVKNEATPVEVKEQKSQNDEDSEEDEKVEAQEEEDEPNEPEVDEKQMAYSTMEGVKILSQPPILKAELHEHQVQGISWMVHMFQNGMPMILGDQMGLGKTIQSIGYMAALQHHLHKKGPFLIVVPLSVLSNWISEIEKFCPSFRAVRFHGPKNERNRIKEEELSDLSEFDIVVTTYEILVSEVNFFRRKYVWTAVIVDEGHRLKNERSQFSEKLRLIACLSKVILSGTPLQNNLKELWAMLYYLAPDVFQSSKPFEEGFDLAKGHIDSRVLRKARKLLSVFMLRRLKEHVAIKLPSRRELTLLVPLTQQQHELYKQYLCSLDSSTLEVVMREEPATSSSASRSNLAGSSSTSSDAVMTTITAVSQSSSSSSNSSNPTPSAAASATTVATSGAAADSDWRKLMNLLLQLRKICNHTYLLPDIAPEPYTVNEDIVGGSGKLMMLDRMLPKLRRNGHRVLIFSQFTSMLDLLEDYCELREYPFVRLDGETNRVKRRLDCRRFNAPRSPLFIFLISTRAGGLGLNLASADTVILYDSDWNPQVDLQAMERAHRIGQTKPVRVYRLVCRGSVEERMVSRAEKKLFLNAMVAEVDPDEQLHEAGGAEEQSEDARRQAEISEALGIGGTAISKGELASLIRFGANAVFEGSVDNEVGGGAGNQISDEDLDVLLEMQGRDLPRPAKVLQIEQGEHQEPSATSSASNGTSAVVAAVEEVDELAQAQQALRDRMQMLKEVDLRQLGSTIYDKKKRKSGLKSDFEATAAQVTSSIATIPGLMDGKRVRKERVVMVDGRGTGYGGAVPVLAETMEKEVVVNDNPDGLKFRSRGRQWTHQSFCCMCGKCAEVPTPVLVVDAPVDDKKAKKADASKNGKVSRASSSLDLPAVPASDVPVNAPVKCAHCPFIFHLECCNGPPPPPAPVVVEPKGAKKRAAPVPPPLTRPAGMFICPHHRCCLCNRSTASAGGLLFRCTGCMTAYCEDCLPQDEIDSVGRCRPLEQLGYDSKQSYFIRCPYCCQLDGFKPGGILNDNEEANKQAKKKEAEESRALSRGQSRTSLQGSRSMASLTSAGDRGDGSDDEVVGENEVLEGAEEEEPEAQTAEQDNAEDAIVPLKTQLMRLQWTEIKEPEPEPLPSPKKRKSKGKKKSKKVFKAASKGQSKKASVAVAESESESEASEESDEEEEDVEDSLSDAAAIWREWSRPSAASKAKKAKTEHMSEIPEGCPAAEGVLLLLDHPLWAALRQVRVASGLLSAGEASLTAMEQRDGDIQLFSHVLGKLEAGRYRSSTHVVADLRYVIETNMLKKARAKLTKDSERAKLTELHELFNTFLDHEFAPNLVL